MSKIIARLYGLLERSTNTLNTRIFYYRPKMSLVDVHVKVEDRGDEVRVEARVRGARSTPEAVNWASRVAWLVSLALDDERRQSICELPPSEKVSGQTHH